MARVVWARQLGDTMVLARIGWMSCLLGLLTESHLGYLPQEPEGHLKVAQSTWSCSVYTTFDQAQELEFVKAVRQMVEKFQQWLRKIGEDYTGNCGTLASGAQLGS
jgi:hypothetical protein